ncbi:hypothetical protein A5787_22520 [Mycobacterium sp. 852002-50816_SCH5313054-b]|uniref:DUF732 domain-containing protein n=1 Tax=Mycobacterium sp. 852002-50816_SCH5313054-b TaxID=1834092 RepID=UPI0007FC9BAB|nr:DUF732 domain-containing protein [Mycobacterium sp. 852002-50816_SCH5313054-b]OBF58731.1 hypothetical protein A5787_22520 [Mycobacterium sp. 852002-50816_SCH5313054-b]
MKSLQGVAAVVAMVCLAAPAHADQGPETDPATDADFLAGLRFAGITYQDPNAAISAAKTLCQLEDTGSSEDEVIGNLQQRNGFSENGAAKFTVIALGAYCPKYITGEGRGPKPEGAVGD